VAIDRATRWVYIAIHPNKSAASARAFLKALAKACPIKITKLLTDNGKEFTDRLFGARDCQPSGEHEFDQLCQALGNLRATLHRYVDLYNINCHKLRFAAPPLKAMKGWFKSSPELSIEGLMIVRVVTGR